MAVDEALSLGLSAAECDFDGFIRFYQWDPPTLSFGYNQKIERLLDIQKALSLGYGVVKRMSGGKMVFHANEWTFSLGFRLVDLQLNGKETFLEMFMNAINPLLMALRSLGIPARFSDSRELRRDTGNSIHCYAAAAGHSIFAGSEKLIGAAAVIKGSCMTIHGSIPITVKYPPSELFLRTTAIEAGVHMTCLEKYLEAEVIEKIPQRVSEKYSELFNCKVTNSDLSVEEDARVRILSKEKYSDLSWK